MNKPKSSYIKEITIVGGGSAGWMTAAALSSMLPAESVCIKLVESEQIGTIGVGEATIPDIINFNRLLGISEAEFLKATNGTFKLGIEFIDWGKIGDRYFHPFSAHGMDMNGIDFHQYWLHLQASGQAKSIDDYSLSALAARQGKFSLPKQQTTSVLSNLKYAYHFDALRYAKFLREYAQNRGVIRVEGKVDRVLQNVDSGDVSGLQMENGEVVGGELFFDCSGFRSLLLNQTLQTKLIDWSHWLPCNTAQTIVTEAAGPILPYTKATAKSAGWQWRIPTQSRTGNGHIYCDQYLNHDEANSILLAGVDGQPIQNANTIHFKTGRSDKFWVKNCIGIGLSTGFLEPLESTSLYLIQQGISRFIALYPSENISVLVRDEYNRVMQEEFEHVRDFIILHYKASQREDTPFWRYCRNMLIPDSLASKINLFQEAGRVPRYEAGLFSQSSWVAVLLGQNITPKIFDPIVANVPLNQIERSLRSINTGMLKALDRLPEHAKFLEHYIATSAKGRI